MVLLSEMFLYHTKEDLSNVSADGFIEGRIKPDNIAVTLLDSCAGFVLEIVGCFVWPLSFVEFILVTGLSWTLMDLNSRELNFTGIKFRGVFGVWRNFARPKFLSPPKV